MLKNSTQLAESRKEYDTLLSNRDKTEKELKIHPIYCESRELENELGTLGELAKEDYISY